MKLEKYMSTLAIEMTRRCNLNCNFCGKGTAQNIDISKEIIDKTLDEVQDAYIKSLRISGGEPLLAPEMICYLVDQIIKRHIYLNSVFIFTNGNVEPNEELKDSLIDLLVYLKKIEPEIRKYTLWSTKEYVRVYKETSLCKAYIIISDADRPDTNNKQIDKLINYYQNSINDEDFCIIRQSEDFKDLGQITLEGNALKNYKDFCGDKVEIDKIRILDNGYYFMAESANIEYEPFLENMIFVLKTLTVSANGNVFPGCLMSYERVDKNYMFNILDCKNNFFDLVNDFCWSHPLNEKAIKIRSHLKELNFCKEKNIKVKHMQPSDYELMKTFSKLVDVCEEKAKDIHAKLPSLDFTTVDLLASTDLVLNLFDKKIDIDFIKEFLRRCTVWDDEAINMISPEWCKGLINFLAEKYKNENENEGENE